MTNKNEVFLGDLVNFKRGYDLPHRDRKSGEFPIISSSGITGFHDELKAKAPAVVTGRYGTLGEVYFVDNDFWPLNTSLYVDDFKGNPPKFIYYYLKVVLNANFNSAGAVPGVNRNYLHKIKVPQPPESKEEIAAILTAYDDLIEANNQRIQLLENMAEEIYKEWFVRLRFPDHESVKVVKGVPEGWSLEKLGGIADIKSSKRVFLKDYMQSGIPFYRSKEIIEKSAGKSTKTELFIQKAKFDELDNKFGSPISGDILLTAVGTIGISYLVTGEDKFYFKDGNLIWLHQKNLAHNQFLFMWLNTDFGKGKISEMTIGSSQAALTISGLKNVEILLPNEKLIEKYINDFFEPMNKQKNMLLQEIQNLTETRDKLLPRLISGKLSVENLDINFPPSMKDALA